MLQFLCGKFHFFLQLALNLLRLNVLQTLPKNFLAVCVGGFCFCFLNLFLFVSSVVWLRARWDGIIFGCYVFVAFDLLPFTGSTKVLLLLAS